MAREIDNMADVLDSRDVIARLETLNESRMIYAAGWNMPGYMPDSEPARFQAWEDAAEYVSDELSHAADQNDEQSGGNPGETADDIEKREHETAELTARAAAIHKMSEPENGFGETIGAYHYWIDPLHGADQFESPEDAEEYAVLLKLAEQGESSPGWEHGETLIRDSYFKEYAQELAEDCGMVNAQATWPNSCIDWDQAARELQMDYTAVEFDGVTYWIRA